MLDIAFVILNFNLVDETVDCVNSIKTNLDTSSYHIVIVDNASTNGAFATLANIFVNDPVVSCISTGKNLGFARGNNAGIQYVRTHDPARFICCLNNDTLLEQKDFYHNLLDCFQKTNAAVIGPLIILRDGRIEPAQDPLLPVSAYQKKLERYERLEAGDKNSTSLKRNFKDWSQKSKEYMLSVPLLSRANQVRHHWHKKIRGENHRAEKALEDARRQRMDCILHGCCLIFTPPFLERLEGFNPRTFLYQEEALLFLMVRRAGLHTCYAPTLRIRHLKNVSINATVHSFTEKERFKRKHLIRSLKILIDELQNGGH